MAFQWSPEAYTEAMKLANAGLKAATVYAANRAKEILSVPAPRRRLSGGRGYVATVPATPGEPPRKLSGRLRSSVAYEFFYTQSPTAESKDIGPDTGRVGTNVKYARALEYHKNRHQWLGRVMNDLQNEIGGILGKFV